MKATVSEAGYDRDALFLETSAQILRLVGGKEISHEIDALMSTFKKTGSSQFVLREFEVVYGGLYDQIAAAIETLLDQHRPRRFLDLWLEVHDLLPKYVPGGRDLLSRFSSRLSNAFVNAILTPAYLRNFIIGQKHGILKSFKMGDEFFDSSSCCVWPHAGLSACVGNPGAHCRLMTLCMDMRPLFIESCEILAEAKVSESKWLRKNIDRIRGLKGLRLMEFVGGNPNSFGDLVIFWEVPDNWTILTRDTAFSILRDNHRRRVGIYYPRWPRKGSRRKCTVETIPESRVFSGLLLNYSPKGACVLAKDRIAKGTKVVLSAREFERQREGVIVRVEQGPRGFVHGIRLPLKAASSGSH